MATTTHTGRGRFRASYGGSYDPGGSGAERRRFEACAATLWTAEAGQPEVAEQKGRSKVDHLQKSPVIRRDDGPSTGRR